MKRKDLLGIQELDREEILEILDTAETLQEISSRPIKKVPTLRGKTVINLFFEASTRTRTSFEIAGKRLSADVINVTASTSSVSKGETLIDTARTLDAMAADCVVIRHSSSGAPHTIARTDKGARGQCRGWRSRTSHSGAAGRPDDPSAQGPAGRPESRDRRRHRPQPGRAIERPSADEMRIARVAVLGSNLDAPGRTAIWLTTNREFLHLTHSMDEALERSGRHHDAARAVRADGRIVLPVRTRVLPILRSDARPKWSGRNPMRSSCIPVR